MWKEAGPAFLAGGASTAWTLSWKEQLLGLIFHKITPQCYKQMLLALHNQHTSKSFHSRLPKELILVILPANPEEQKSPLVQRHKVWRKNFPAQLLLPVTPVSEGNLAHSDRN